MNLWKALRHYAPNAQYSCGTTYDTLKWTDIHVLKPTLAQLEAAHAEALAAEAKVAYKAQRKAEYPSVEEQLDMLWHAMDVGTFPKCNLFYNTINAVKQKYPKPE